MAELREKIEAEVENIERVLAELPAAGACGTLSLLELAGVGTLLQNFYNGIENIPKQCMASQGVKLPRGETWHRDLIDLAASRGLVMSETAEQLRKYMAFRHFVRHGYAFNLSAELIEPLVQGAKPVFTSFLGDIERSLKEP